MKRVIMVVLDSVGVGELPDASFYGDAGSNTLAHTAQAVGGLQLPWLQSLGLGCITEIAGVPCSGQPRAAYGKMAERSPGKDTTTGHWEMTGIILSQAFPVFPAGFPPEIMQPFSKAIGRAFLGNVKASGTEIIAELGAQHLATGKPIVYTSADSVFQIAAHEAVVPVEQLYAWCEMARELLSGDYAVGRVIARPFVGEPGNFQRTANRKDYSLAPPQEMLLDKLKAAGEEVVAIGKINDVFAGRGITASVHTANNDDGMSTLLTLLDNYQQGLLFINLVDFDMVYGHRNNAAGYAQALERVDGQLAAVSDKMTADDLLIILADHGCDPTFHHTDHTREYVPLLVYGAQVRPGPLGVRETFADVGATVACLLGAAPLAAGKDFSQELGLKCNENLRDYGKETR
ncbi:MAG TPA: phosphopentomutase [Oscillospiraceae bacterium]|nr:phosphopentomutase [Oscillospiraceae bacterium]